MVINNMNFELSELETVNIEFMVHCKECEKEWCALRQYMKYSLGIEDPFCQLGEKKEN